MSARNTKSDYEAAIRTAPDSLVERFDFPPGAEIVLRNGPFLTLKIVNDNGTIRLEESLFVKKREVSQCR